MLSLFSANAAAAAWGLYPLWVGTLIAIVPIHAGFTVLHEASHGTITNRARGLGWIDTSLGTAHAALLVYDLPTFRFLHLRHHQFTNDAASDPDYWLQKHPLPLVIMLSLVVPLHYLRLYLRAALRGEVAPFQVALTLVRVGLLAALAAALFIAAPAHTLLLWLVPSAIASVLISVSHRMLHLAEETPDRARSTRIIAGETFWEWLICPFFWLNNHHLIHHENPRLPVAAHGSLFREIEPELAARGASITRIGSKRA